MADSELAAIGQQITDECSNLLLPINGFIPTIEPLRVHDFVNHLKHDTEEQAKKDKRSEVNAMIATVDGKISSLKAEKIQLAAQRQSGMDNPEIVGRVGLIIMDIEVLESVREKCAAELETLPAPGQHKDWGLEGWNGSVKAARVKALFSVIEASEKVIFGALQSLKALNAVSLNYSRTVKAS